MATTDYETDSNFEFDIEKIINSIELNDIRTLEEINNLNNEVLAHVFSDFLVYDINKENLSKAKTLLNDSYEFVENVNELKPKDYVMGIKLEEFYNLKLKQLGFYFSTDKNFIITGYYIGNKRYKYDFEKYIFFRKLNDLDKTKLFLIKTIHE